MNKIQVFKYFIATTFTVLITLAVSAQVKTYLPYSIFGIGELTPRGFSRNIAMGRTGIAMSSDKYLNNLNPASYHDMDSISFFFDFGLSAAFVKYKTNYATQYGNDFNFRNLAIGFRASRHWTSSIGVTPYSTIGYKIESERNVEGTEDMYSAVISGAGGLSQFYWDNSYVLFDHLSLGVNVSYLFGNAESIERVHYDKFTYDILYTEVSRLNKVYVDFGAQYFFRLKDKFRVSLGGVFGNSHQLNFEQQITVSQTDGTVFDDELTKKEPLTFPMYFGGGLSVEWDGKLTVNADYLYHNWSESDPPDNTDYTMINTNAYKVGVEYIPGPLNQYGYLGRIRYRAGYYFEESYLEINKTSFADKGLSLGFGIPFLKNKTSLNFSYNLGSKGTLKNGLIKENYNAIMVSLTLHDWWFIKPKYD